VLLRRSRTQKESLQKFNNMSTTTDGPFCVFLPSSIPLQAHYVTVVEDRPIMYEKCCLAVPVFYFWPKLTHPAARFLCDSWASCKA